MIQTYLCRPEKKYAIYKIPNSRKIAKITETSIAWNKMPKNHFDFAVRAIKKRMPKKFFGMRF